MDRRTVLGAATGALAAQALLPASAWAQAKPEISKLAMGFGLDPVFAPHMLAMSKGWFRDAGFTDVTTKTFAGGAIAGEALVASIVTFRGNDFKTAAMIRQGTAQGFEEQSAATAALRGRVADIDNYNVKATTNVYFDTGKWILSDQAKAELCIAAATAKNTPNALLLVVGYTDSVGDEDFNQELSEKRASRVLAHLQQVCRWKQFRTLTPSGMAESDPVADNSTDEGKAQNRRVAVNVLVSKAVDGL